jgi:CrcB protein
MGMGFPDNRRFRLMTPTAPVEESVSFATCLAVAAGGAFGTLARYLISLTALPFDRELPWGTIAVNVTGCFIIGLVGTLTLAQGRYPISEGARLFFMVGLCGGYTTFSAFSLQTFDLLRSGALVRAAANVLISVVLCIAAVALGHAIAARLNGNATQIAQTDIEKQA